MNKWKHICASIARTLLGLTFIFSGFVKAVDPLGTVYKIEDYLKAFGGFFNNLMPLAGVAAFTLIIFEFVLGVCLLFNVRTKLTSWLALLMMALMTPLTLYIAIANPVSDCGCFGDAIVLSNWATFWKNIVLLALVIVLLCWKRYVPQTFVGKAEWGIAILAILLVAGFMAYNLTHLPVIDFRPYKVGNNIPELMQYPDDAQPDIYRTTYIYEKDGNKQEFTLSDYPQGDSTWTFVESKSVLVKKGYEPPIHDFEIVDIVNLEDITEDVLDADVAVLAVMYNLRKADKRQLEKLIRLAQIEQQNGHMFCILTGSSSGDIDEFLMSQIQPKCPTQTDYELFEQAVCTCDPVTLKTIVRANPGVIVLNSGTVVDKYNLANCDLEDLENLKEDNIIDEEYYVEEEYDDDTPLNQDFSDTDVYTDEQDFSEE